MSANTVDRALITQFSSFVRQQTQQIRSRIRPHVQILPMSGDNFAYDGLGSVEAREVNGRIVAATFDDIEHLRRKISRRRFIVNLPIDESDVRGMLADQNGHYSAAVVAAMERVFDRVGVEGATADALTGRDFGTAVTFANDGGLTVDATGGVTYEKILEANKNFRDNDVGNDIPITKLFLTTGAEEEALMKETELTSGDFSRQMPIDANGELVRVVGNNMVYYGASAPNPILDVTSAVRTNLIISSTGLVYGLSKEMRVEVQPRTDYIETTQVQIIGELGAVRAEGKHIQKFTTTVV